MALIKCPECGKENVSELSERCPKCGFGIKAYTEQMLKQKKQLDRLQKKLQTDLNDVNNTAPPSMPSSYLDYITYKYPRILLFLVLLIIFGIFILKSIIITCVGIALAVICSVLGYYLSYKKTSQQQKYIIDNWESIKNNKKIKILERYYKEYYNIQNGCNADIFDHNQTQNFDMPKCPTCKSTDIYKITITSKVVNTALFGILGTKRHKTFHCNNCGYEW